LLIFQNISVSLFLGESYVLFQNSRYGGLEMKIGEKEDGSFRVKVLAIVWDHGEYEDLVADFHKNCDDLSKMKPENAIKMLRLHAIYMMDEKIYRALEPKIKCPHHGSILDQDFDRPDGLPNEKDLQYSLIAGTDEWQRGLALWKLLEAIKPL